MNASSKETFCAANTDGQCAVAPARPEMHGAMLFRSWDNDEGEGAGRCRRVYMYICHALKTDAMVGLVSLVSSSPHALFLSSTCALNNFQEIDVFP